MTVLWCDFLHGSSTPKVPELSADYPIGREWPGLSRGQKELCMYTSGVVKSAEIILDIQCNLLSMLIMVHIEPAMGHISSKKRGLRVEDAHFYRS
jgi:hypothetical protein